MTQLEIDLSFAFKQIGDYRVTGKEALTMIRSGFKHYETPILVNQTLLKAAIKTFGMNSQVELIHEECLELALAIQQARRSTANQKEKHEAIIDEIADVTIMMNQAALLFPVEEINDRIKFKMNRLQERLSE